MHAPREHGRGDWQTGCRYGDARMGDLGWPECGLQTCISGFAWIRAFTRSRLDACSRTRTCSHTTAAGGGAYRGQGHARRHLARQAGLRRGDADGCSGWLSDAQSAGGKVQRAEPTTSRQRADARAQGPMMDAQGRRAQASGAAAGGLACVAQRQSWWWT